MLHSTTHHRILRFFCLAWRAQRTETRKAGILSCFLTVWFQCIIDSIDMRTRPYTGAHARGGWGSLKQPETLSWSGQKPMSIWGSLFDAGGIDAAKHEPSDRIRSLIPGKEKRINVGMRARKNVAQSLPV